jgi:hypothetical protein
MSISEVKPRMECEIKPCLEANPYNEVKSYCNTAKGYLSWGGGKVVELYKAAAKPGEIQKKALAFVRTSVGIASIYCSPMYAAGSGLVCSILPKQAKAVSDKLDGMVTGLWNSMSFNQRVVAAGVGITITVAGYGLLHIPAAILSAKLGAELAIRNHAKQNIAEAAEVAAKEHAHILQ